MDLYRYRQTRTHRSFPEAMLMYLKRSTAVGLLGALLLSGACTAAQEPRPAQNADPKEDSTEMVEVRISLPDGRVIVRKERKEPSRINDDSKALKRRKFAGAGKGTKVFRKTAAAGEVNILAGGVSGGSNGAAGSASSAGGGGGGGGSSSSSSGGGGGGTFGTDRSSGGGSDTGNTGDTGSTSIPIVQPDNDLTVRMYAWENSGEQFQHVTKTYLADPRSRTPSQLAQRIADRIEEDRPEKVVLRLWKEFDPASRDPFDISNPAELIASGGYTQGLTDYWNQFAIELASLGIVPDYIVADMERGIGFWSIPLAQRRDFFTQIMSPTSQLSETLPESMRNVTVDQLMNYRDPQGSIALNDYNTFASRFRANLIHNVFENAFETAYGRYIPISNYKDLYQSFSLRHYTNRPLPLASSGGISAPVAYLDLRTENSPRYANTQKDQRWNRLIDALNKSRSAATIGWVTPWISSPGYGRFGADTWARTNQLDAENQIWSMMMDHMLAMGIDTFILWNPGPRFNPNARTSDDFIDQWLAEHPRASSVQLRNLPEIQLDAEFIETNGVVTYYQDFLDAMNDI